MKDEDRILLIATGGSVDGIFRDDEIQYGESSLFPEYMQRYDIDNVGLQLITLKHSGDLNKDDLARMLSAAKTAPESKILVAQGIGTICDNALHFEDELEGQEKTVVLFGSETPLVGFSPTDGPLYFGMALGTVQILPNGVYVCGHRGVIPARVASIDSKTGTIYSKEQE